MNNMNMMNNQGMQRGSVNSNQMPQQNQNQNNQRNSELDFFN